MNHGWVCPKCGKVNAPWKESCDCVQVSPNIIYYYPQPWNPYINPLPYTPTWTDFHTSC